jgi:asparagine synthase (glutamine-hydrolysing)
MPGAWLRYDLQSHNLDITEYWKFTLTPDDALTDECEDELAEELRSLLMNAVRRRMMSDVPLGVFLSGGLDSSTALIGATEALGRGAVRTFTIGFTDPSFDESHYARQVAGAFGSIHRERVLDIALAGRRIPEVLAALDEPMGDASILPTYLLCQFARENVTVALSGDGGDELFAGYDPFMALSPARTYDRLMPRAGHALARFVATRLRRSDKNMSFDFKVRRTLAGLSYPWPMRNPVWMAPLDPKEWAAVFNAPMRAEDVYGDAMAVWEREPKLDTIDRTLEFFARFYLPNDILTKVDRAAMMVSLESRAVFLDNDVVAFCQRLPNRFKLRRGVRKYLLKKALARDLAPAILNRAKKGFGIPVSKWLRSIPPDPPLTPIEGFRMAEVARRWADHRANRADNRLFLWNWMSLHYSQAAT